MPSRRAMGQRFPLDFSLKDEKAGTFHVYILALNDAGERVRIPQGELGVASFGGITLRIDQDSRIKDARYSQYIVNQFYRYCVKQVLTTWRQLKKLKKGAI